MSYKVNKKTGFSLVEMLVYVAILSFMLVVIVSTTSVLVNSQSKINTTRAVESSSVAILERVVREIRNASSVNGAQSVLGTNPGTLALNSTDTNGNADVVIFNVVGGRLHVSVNGVDQGPLSQSEITIQNLVFQSTTTPNSVGVKINLTMSAGQGSSYRSEQFYSSAILRSSY